MPQLVAFVDGGSHGNPGPAGVGVVLTDDSGHRVEISESIGHGDNNYAEYSALLMHATQGKCYSTAEYEQFLGEAGFRRFTFATTAADRGMMTAQKPA